MNMFLSEQYWGLAGYSIGEHEAQADDRNQQAETKMLTRTRRPLWTAGGKGFR